MSRTNIPSAAAHPSDLELRLSSLVRSPDPWLAMDLASWGEDQDLLGPDAFAAWCRAATKFGKQVEGACKPVRIVALHFATFPPTADLTSIRTEAVRAYLNDELGTGQPAAAAFVSILDLVHLAALSRQN